MSRIDEALRRIARRDTVEPTTVVKPGRGVVWLDRYPFEGQQGSEDPPVSGAVPLPSLNETPRPHAGAEPRAVAAVLSPAVHAERAAEADDKLIDLAQIADYVGFVLRAVRRRAWLSVATLLFVLGLTGTAVAIWPRTYHVEAKLLAQRNDVMAALNNPGRTIPRDADAPTRGAGETVLRRDNLIALIKQTDLLNEWQRTRPPALRVKDRVFRALRGEPTDAEKLDAMVGLLEQRFSITTDTEGVVLVSINWPNARMAYELVQAAMQNFLETRQVAETSAIADSVRILEQYEASLQNGVNATFAELQEEQSKRRVSLHDVPVPAPAFASAPASKPAAAAAPRPQTTTDYALTSATPETASRVPRLRTAIEAKRQEIHRLEEFRAQQLSDLQGKLSAALTIYTEDHPAVTSLRQTMATVSKDSPQLTALRTEAQNLETEYETAIGQQLAAERAESAQRPTILPVPEPPAAKPALPRLNDGLRAQSRPAIETAPAGLGPEYSNPTSVRLRMQLSQLGDIRDRLESARIELATSQASFKYRYGLVHPPQMPRAPLKPNVLLVLIAGALGALALAIAAPVGADVLSGRVIEAWQVERQIGVPVLATLRHL